MPDSALTLDPAALVNMAPATALCVLVYLELRALRPMLRVLSTALVEIRTLVSVVAGMHGVKLRKATGPVALQDEPEEEEKDNAE